MTSPPGSLSVGLRPRVELAPPYDYSLGFAAVELMARAGKPLDQWQIDACELMMARRDDKWACREFCEWTARQNGKGAILEARAIAGLLLFGEDLISWSAHQYRTSMEAFRRVKALLRALGRDAGPNLIEVDLDDWVPVKINNTNGEESFERLDTGQRIKFVARSKDSGRGFTAAVQLIDEAYAFTLQQQEALAPTTLAVADEQTIYMSTPPLTGMSGEVMYSLRARADAGGDEYLGYRDWGIGGWLEELDGVPGEKPPVNVEDRKLWAASNPALGIRIREDKLESLRRKLGREGFAREQLCVWPKQVAMLGAGIDPDQWEAAADAESHPGEALVLAVDASWGGRSAAIASAGRRADGRLHTKIVDYRSNTSWVVERLLELVERWQPKKVMFDPNGPAGALGADIVSAGIELEKCTGRDMAQACGALLNDLKEDRIRHCDQEALNDAVGQAAVKATVNGTVQWDRRDPTGDICPLVAVTEAAHGFRLFGAQEEVIPWATWG